MTLPPPVAGLEMRRQHGLGNSELNPRQFNLIFTGRHLYLEVLRPTDHFGDGHVLVKQRFLEPSHAAVERVCRGDLNLWIGWRANRCSLAAPTGKKTERARLNANLCHGSPLWFDEVGRC